MSDLSLESLEEATRAWAPAIRFLEEVDSTNRVAVEWAGDGAAEGTLVVTDYQTSGRGRLDRKWFAPPGSSLLFSLILRPSIVIEDLGLLSLAAAAAVAGAVSEEGVEAKVKWPNDVLIAGKKVAGILAEVSTAADRAVTVVVGVGINVNLDKGDLPSEIRESAGSISMATGKRHDRGNILVAFLRNFGHLYDGIPGKPPNSVLHAYRPLCETIGKQVRVELDGRQIEGTAVDIHPTGGLVLDSGEVVRVGDVVHLR